MAQRGEAVPLELPAWKYLLSAACAIVLGLLFIVAGVWKVTDPYSASVRLSQLLIPASLSLAAAIILGIVETFAGLLLLVPRFRRWGAWLTAALLVMFMVYVGIFYERLQGEECSCFPWLKRAVGPGFFISDAMMLLTAIAAGRWSRPPDTKRAAGLMLAAVSVFALVSFGMAATRLTGTPAPQSITVNSQPFSLQEGKVFVYFFDPECSHCDQAARQMATYHWNDVKLVAVPTRAPHFAESFLQDTGFRAVVSNDLQLLKEAFPFGDAPYGVAIENGRQQLSLPHFDENQPAAELKKAGFIQ
jgi:uncharacterized membrane protein YphA (DoxX/SURF4 family)